MSDRREYRRVTFARKLDVKQLRAALARTMRQIAKDPTSAAAPARLESILVEPNQTVVYLSGNSPGLDAVAKGVRSSLTGAKIGRAERADARRLPRTLTSKAKR